MKIATILLCFIISLSIAAQKDRRKEYVEDLQFARKQSGHPCCDTLFFQSGKPVFIIASVSSPILANPDYFYANREKKELEANFKEIDPIIQLLTLHSSLRFDNDYNELIDMNDLENEYEALAFWDGKKESHVEILNSNTGYTEFVASKLHMNRVSSYIKEYNDLLKQITIYDGVFAPSVDSPGLAEKYLSNAIQNLFIHDDISNYGIKYNFDNVNQVNISMQLGDKKSSFGKIIFDRNKNPVSVSITNEDGRTNTATISYLNNLPEKMEADRLFNFFYRNDTMIVKQSDLRYEFYSLSDHGIKRDGYDFSFYPEYEYRVYKTSTSTETKNGCIYSVTGEDCDKKCFSNTEGQFPLRVTEYSNADKYWRKSIVEKITPDHYRVTTMDIDEEQDSNDKNLEADYIRDIYLNEKGNISVTTFKRRDEKESVTLTYDYVYF